MRPIGEMKLSEVMPALKEVADAHGLRLNRAKDFKTARMIIANLYFRF
jgi:hypothetical protein